MGKQPFIIGIAGGSGSGKTTFTQKLVDVIGAANVLVISHDSYYRDIGSYEKKDAATINFDHPDALETSLFISHLSSLRRGEKIQKPIYNFSTHQRQREWIEVAPKQIIVVEGILLFLDVALREMFDMKIYIDTNDNLRLRRRIERDTAERGRTKESVVAQFHSTVLPMQKQFVETTKQFADYIFSGGENFDQPAALVYHEVMKKKIID